MKKCSKCHVEKPVDSFYKYTHSKDGYKYACKQCEYEYYSENKERMLQYKKDYYIKNKEKFNALNQEWAKKNKTKKKLDDKAYYEANKDKIRKTSKEYRQKNAVLKAQQDKAYYEANKNKEAFIKTRQEYSKRTREKMNKYEVEKRKTDIQYRLQCNLRKRISKILRGQLKGGSAVRDLGCTMSFFKTYIESKFQPGMNWDNYGLYGWHIDHINPLSNFNLSNREQVLKACHYTNLQPLWAKDNLSKGSKVVEGINNVW